MVQWLRVDTCDQEIRVRFQALSVISDLWCSIHPCETLHTRHAVLSSPVKGSRFGGHWYRARHKYYG